MEVITKKTFLPLTLFLFAVSFGAMLYAESATEISAEEAFEQRQQIVAYSQKFLGKGYARGATGPQSFDCSGLVYAVARDSIGLQLPRMSSALYSFSTKVSDDQREPGDLVFFKTTGSGSISHAGIYLGEGKFIHSASDGPQVGVIISSLDEKYWKAHYAGAGQILPSAYSE